MLDQTARKIEIDDNGLLSTYHELAIGETEGTASTLGSSRALLAKATKPHTLYKVVVLSEDCKHSYPKLIIVSLVSTGAIAKNIESY